MCSHLRLCIAGSLALLFAALPLTMQAQDGSQTGVSAQYIYCDQTPFTQLEGTFNVHGDYVAAGIGLRNVGSGTINISLPPGSSIVLAYMTWAVIWDDTHPVNTAKLNGTTVTGQLLGTCGSPCWGGDGIDFFFAEVTTAVVDGANLVSDVPSGLTDGTPPLGSHEYPLAEGASLIVAFCNPLWERNTIAMYANVQTFSNGSVSGNMGSYSGISRGWPGDQIAQTTFIMADGQVAAPNDKAYFNNVQVSGPGTAVKPVDAFDGEDGRVYIDDQYGLWDTHTLDVSAFFPANVPTSVTASVDAASDCLTWGVQVISVKSDLDAFMDIKAGSCPNSFNLKNKGILPVDLLGRPHFNVYDVDPSTVKLMGVAPVGNASYADVATPYLKYCSRYDCNDCNTSEADGYMDMHFKFSSQDIAAAIALTGRTEECFQIMLTGKFYDGTPFLAWDALRIVNFATPKTGNGVAAYDFMLEQNAPNPVTTSTLFEYSLPEAATVRLEVFNTLGQRVARIDEGARAEGRHSISWDGLNDSGILLPSGTYLYRLTAGEKSLSRTLIITH